MKLTIDENAGNENLDNQRLQKIEDNEDASINGSESNGSVSNEGVDHENADLQFLSADEEDKGLKVAEADEMQSQIAENSSIEEHSLTGEDSDHKSPHSRRKRKKGKRKKAKMTVRKDSPSKLRSSNELKASLSSSPARSAIQSPSRNNRAASSGRVRGNDGLVMDNLMPVYSELVDGLFKRPIVVSILSPTDRVDFLETLKGLQPVGRISRDKSKMIAYSAKQEKAVVGDDGDSLTEAAFLAHHNINRISKKKTNFIVKIYDLVESKEARYEVDVKLFSRLRFEFTHPEYFPLLKVYYKPQNLSWWARNVKHFLVIYVKPTSELSVVVDKQVMRQYVKNKIKQHLWMESAARSADAAAESADRDGGVARAGTGTRMSAFERQDTALSMLTTDDNDFAFSAPPSPMIGGRPGTLTAPAGFDYWRNIEDYYYSSLTAADRRGRNWEMMERIFTTFAEPRGAGTVMDEEVEEEEGGGEGVPFVEKQFVLSAAWTQLEAMVRNVPDTEKQGEKWTAVDTLFLTVQAATATGEARKWERESESRGNAASARKGSPPRSARFFPNEESVGSLTKSDASMEKKKRVKTKSRGKKATAKMTSSSVTSLPSLQSKNSHSRPSQPLLLTKSHADSADRRSPSASSFGSNRKSGRPSPVRPDRVQSAPLQEVKKELLHAVDSALKDQHVAAEARARERQETRRHTRHAVDSSIEVEEPDALDLLSNEDSKGAEESLQLPAENKDALSAEFSKTFPLLSEKSGRGNSPIDKPRSPSKAIEKGETHSFLIFCPALLRK